MELPPDAPTVRLCQLNKWPNFNGYGFNLHTDKVKNIQTLGEIDKGSPAEAAGLMKGDRIVEVNGQNVFNENHKQVVERIKAIPNETRLLVVDPVSDQWYRERNIVIKGTLPSVKVLTGSKDVNHGNRAYNNNNNNNNNNNQNNNNNNESGSNDNEGNSKMMNGDSVEQPRPRLSNLRKWPDFDGYGFNLHADKAKGTQFIGIIDPHSPAESAGVRQNDKIIEVNGENVEKLSHREIVERIKTFPNETTLLVVDEATNKYYRDRGIQISSSMKDLLRLETPPTNPRNTSASEKIPALPKTAPPPQANKSHTINTTVATAAPMSNPNLVPRKCNLRKWADYEGYGFNLHADKANNLHFIGEVDEGSPAKLGGLKPGDRLVEVNGVNIDKIPHREIIERIKSNPQETVLLVVCKETDQLYKQKGIVPRGDMKEVRYISTPAREVEQMDNDTSSKSSSPKMIPSTPSSNRSEEIPPATPSTTVDEYDVNGINSPSPAMNVEPPAYSEARNGRASVDSPIIDEKELGSGVTNISLNSDDTEKNHTNLSEDSGGAVFPIFSMKASDAREMLRQRKKKDPRVQNMDLMQKFKIMEQL